MGLLTWSFSTSGAYNPLNEIFVESCKELFGYSANFKCLCVVLYSVDSTKVEAGHWAQPFLRVFDDDREWVFDHFIPTLNWGFRSTGIDSCIVFDSNPLLSRPLKTIRIQRETKAAALHLSNHDKVSYLGICLLTKLCCNHKFAIILGYVTGRFSPQSFEYTTHAEKSRG